MTTPQYPAICAGCIFLGFNAATLIAYIDLDDKGTQHLVRERGSEFIDLVLAVEAGNHEWSPRGYWRMNQDIVKSMQPVTAVKGTALCSAHAVAVIDTNRGLV